MRIVIALGGNGPQAGLLSLRAESYAGAAPYPLDVLYAGTARGREDSRSLRS